MTTDTPRKYRVTVERKQVWHFDVEAADPESAKDIGDAMAQDEPAHDDWAYDTTAREVA